MKIGTDIRLFIKIYINIISCSSLKNISIQDSHFHTSTQYKILRFIKHSHLRISLSDKPREAAVGRELCGQQRHSCDGCVHGGAAPGDSSFSGLTLLISLTKPGI